MCSLPLFGVGRSSRRRKRAETSLLCRIRARKHSSSLLYAPRRKPLLYKGPERPSIHGYRDLSPAVPAALPWSVLGHSECATIRRLLTQGLPHASRLRNVLAPDG